jgi:hypothetical protein
VTPIDRASSFRRLILLKAANESGDILVTGIGSLILAALTERWGQRSLRLGPPFRTALLLRR